MASDTRMHSVVDRGAAVAVPPPQARDRRLAMVSGAGWLAGRRLAQRAVEASRHGAGKPARSEAARRFRGYGTSGGVG